MQGRQVRAPGEGGYDFFVNEPPYTAAFVARDREMTLEEVLEAIEASRELQSFITPGQLGVKRSEPAINSDFIATSLHISLPEATDALKAAIGEISGK